jgi:hypothetical protein
MPNLVGRSVQILLKKEGKKKEKRRKKEGKKKEKRREKEGKKKEGVKHNRERAASTVWGEGGG